MLKRGAHRRRLASLGLCGDPTSGGGRRLGVRAAIMRRWVALVMVGGSLGLSSLTSTAVGGTSGTNGLANETPAQILAASRTAVSHVRFVQEVEQIGEGSHRSTFDLGLTSGAGLRMSAVGTGLGKCRDIVLAHGQSFINCDVSFLVRMHVPDPSALAGKWLRVPSVTARSIGGGVGANAAMALTREIDTYLAASGSLTRGKEVTVDGRPAIPLSDESGNTRLFISATGQPYPIEVTTINTSLPLDRVRFSAFNVPIVLRPPAHWIACSAVKRNLRCAT